MNESLLTKIKVHNMMPIQKHLPVWQIIILLMACVASIMYISNFAERKQTSNTYLLKDITAFSNYDPYVFKKVYIPVSEKRGLLVSLGSVYHNCYWDVVLGGSYEVRFLKGSTDKGIVKISSTGITSTEKSSTGEVTNADTAQFKVVMNCPETAINEGYDAILFIPKSGRGFFLSYLAPIDGPEESLVLKTIKTQKYKAYYFGGEYAETGRPNDVNGIYPFLDKVKDDSLLLQIENTSSLLDVNLLKVINNEGKTIALFPDNTILKAYRKNAGFGKYNMQILSDDYLISGLYVCYQYKGDSAVKKAKVNPFLPENEEVYNSTLVRIRDNMSDFPMLKEENNIITLKGENVVLDKPLFIPNGKSFHLKAGQTVDLQNGAYIISRSPIFAEGTQEQPIILTSTDNSINAGIAVIQAGGRSKLDYLVCDNLGEVSSGVWKLTGAVTFYESDVDINHCKFLNNRSEDGLNAVGSDIYVTDSILKNTYQDAFDSDFCTGIFDGCHFELTGNDAFDISTSTMTVKNSTFKNIHDKAVSVGERSTITIENIYAEDVQIGLGAKDSSTISASDITIKNAFIGFSAYQKKPEFGPSSITVNGFSLQGAIDFKYLIENQDTLLVNGKRWFATNKKKEALIIDRLINEEPIK